MSPPPPHDAARRILSEMLDFVDRLGVAGVDETTRREGYQWLFEFCSGMVEYYTHADPARPILMPMVTPFRRFLGDLRFAKHCYVARLSARFTYRLRCHPGDAVFTSITVHAGEDGGLAGGSTLGKLNNDEIVSDPDGSFEIVIGVRPTGPNTIVIDDSVSSLMTREFFYAPLETRREARWTIEVIGDGTNAVAGASDVGSGFEAALTNIARMLPRYPRPIDSSVFGSTGLNQFEDFFAFRPDQVVTWGNLDAIHTTMPWSLSPDEAIVIDGGAPVECSWWGVTLSNRYLASYGRGHPTALPGNEITPDSDGRWRVVLSDRPPVAGHWLSTGGHRNGVVRIRWLAARARPERPTVRVVPAVTT